MARLTQTLDESSSTGKKLKQIYSELGISLTDQQGNLRGTYDVLNDLSKQWNNLSTNQQQYIALTSAGANQWQNFAALMNNWGNVIKANATALDSSGSAMRENERYMESLSAKLSNLRSQFEELVLGDGVISSFIKGIVDAGTAVLKFANTDLGQAIIMATALTAALSNLIKVYKLLAQASAAVKAAEGVGVLAKAFTALTTAGTAAAGATATAGAGAAGAGAAAGAAFPPILIAVGAIAALTAAIYGGKKAYDALIPTIGKTNQSLQDSKKDYNEATTEVETLEKQIHDLAKAMNDIRSKGKLETTDENDLKRMQRETAELQIQLSLARQKQAVELAELNRRVSKTSTQQFSGTVWSVTDDHNMTDQYGENAGDYWAKQTHETGTATDMLKLYTAEMRKSQEIIEANNKQIAVYNDQMEHGGITVHEAKDKIQQLNDENKIALGTYNKNAEQIGDYVEVVGELAGTQQAGHKEAQEAIEDYNKMSSTIVSVGDETNNFAVQTQNLTDDLEENSEQTNENGDNVEKVTDKIGDLTKNMSSLSKGLKPVNTAMKEFAKDGKVTSSSLLNIQKQAESLGLDFSDLINKISNGKATTQDINNAFEEMQQQIISNSGVLDNLTDANVDYVGTLLEEMGVVDGTKKAHAELEAQKLLNKEATEGLESVTVNEIAQLLKEETATNSTKIALLNLYYAKLQANSTTVMTDGDIQNLLDLANAAGMAATAVANAKSAISSANASNGYRGYDASGHQLSDIEMDEAAYMMDAIKTGKYTPNQWTWTPIEFKGGTATNSSGGGSTGGSSGGSSSKAKDPVEEAKKQAEDFQKLHKQILDDRLKYLDHELNQEVISVEEHNELKQRAYGQYFSALSSMGIDYLQEQNEFFDKQREWQEKRFEDSIKYEQHLIDRQIKALQKQKDEESDDYDDQIDRLEEKRDKIVDALDEEIDLREEQKDAELDAIKEEQDAIKKKHDEVINNLKDQIDILKEEKSANKETWDERIAQLDAVNDELEKQKQLEEKLEALAKARATRVKVFKNGRFVYDVDREAVSEAQKNLNEYKEKLRQERAKKSLQDQRDAEQKNYEERIDALEKYKDQQDKYYDEIEKRLDDNYDAVEKKYKDLLDALKKQRDSEKKLYDDKIKNLQKLKKEQEKEYQDMIDDLNDLKDSYSDALEDMENVQNGFLDATKAFTYDYSKSMEENLKAFMEYVTGVKDGYKELEQAKQEYKNSSSESERLDEGADDYTNIKNYSDPSQQHEAWEKAGSPSSSSYSVPSGDSRGSTSSLADKYGGIVTERTVRGHASGVATIGSDELAIVGENPNKEIVVGSRLNNGTLMSLNRGTGVINAKSTRTLAGLVNSIGGSNNLIDRNTSVVQTFSFDKIVLPNVTNANSFVEALSREFNNRAIQYGNIRR